MINSLLLVLIWHLSGTMPVLKPLGVKLCEELCVSYGQCNSPLYVEQQLECYLTETHTIPIKLAQHLPAPKRDNETTFYRVMFSRAKKPVTIKRRKNISKLSAQTKTNMESYTTVGVGKGSIDIKFHKQRKIWSEARKVCQADGGDLVKVDTKQKKVALKTFMKSFGKYNVWIGLTDVARNNTYIWTDGSPLIFKDWQIGQPDHSSSGQDEHCVVTGISKHLFVTVRGWIDVPCSKITNFICEKSIL